MSLNWDALNTPILCPEKWPNEEIPDSVAADDDGDKISDWGWAILESAVWATLSGFPPGKYAVDEKMLKRIKLSWRAFGSWPTRLGPDDEKIYAKEQEIRACVLGLTTNAGCNTDSQFLKILMEIQ